MDARADCVVAVYQDYSGGLQRFLDGGKSARMRAALTSFETADSCYPDAGRLGKVRLPTFGVGADRSQQEWNAMIRQLVASGFLAIDIKGYGGLSLADKGMALLKGRAEFRFRPDTVRQPSRGSRRRERAGAEALDASGLELQDLKGLRLRLAQERAVPAYVIFSDKTLIDMAARRPATREEFGQVYGVGHAKLDEFADIFLQAIAEFRGRP